MKLDKDLIRDILLAVEASDHDPRGFMELEIEGRTRAELSYHVKILDDAGFLEAEDLSTLGPDGFEWQPQALTYRGHEFLETVRDSAVWQATKQGAEKAGTASVALIWEIGKAVAKNMISDRLGITIGE
ncbi:DUF2513 domain-containing protein [Sphingomonas sp. TZW2008]|uniref:DUF2513 domain-containing protein n=1 Tax=Sphingomonas sp. TZW2008 TaxID=1917973 RepID=UPI000A26FEAE|nr:DUF2513 domain-containing protein [Sphingomonas sp. TZW2008]